MAPWILDEMKREVFLVTAANEGARTGMIITWVAPAGLIPDQKRIMMALSPTNATTQMLLETKRFGIHLLQKSQASLVPQFGGQSGRDVDKFTGVQVEVRDGIPLLKGTCGWCIGKVVSSMDVGDRLIVVADMENEESSETQDPLLLSELNSLLPSEEAQALSAKFQADIARDRTMRK